MNLDTLKSPPNLKIAMSSLKVKLKGTRNTPLFIGISTLLGWCVWWWIVVEAPTQLLFYSKEINHGLPPTKHLSLTSLARLGHDFPLENFLHRISIRPFNDLFWSDIFNDKLYPYSLLTRSLNNILSPT